MWHEAAKPVGYGIAGYLALLLLIQGLAWPMAMEEMSDQCPENSSNCVYSSQTKSYRTELPSLRINASIDSVTIRLCSDSGKSSKNSRYLSNAFSV